MDTLKKVQSLWYRIFFFFHAHSSKQVQHAILVFFLSMVILWGQIEAEVLYSVDGIVYSLVAKELTRKPFVDWVSLTWNTIPFFEHPHLLHGS